MLIPSLKTQEMTVLLTEPEVVNYNSLLWPKKPPMPCVPEVNLNNTFIHMQQDSRARAQMIGLELFKDIATKIECPEHNGYCSAMNRRQDYSIREKPSIVYLPGSKYRRFACTHATCSFTELAYSFCGITLNSLTLDEKVCTFYSIGSLMVGMRRQEVLQKVFCNVPKILTGKKYPQCVRALR